MGMSNYLETAVANETLRGVDFTTPTVFYVALYTSNPTDADTGTEVTDANYLRQAVTFGEPFDDNGRTAVANTALIEFETGLTGYGTVTHIGVRDASTGGNLLYHGALAVPVIGDEGVGVRIQIGQLKISLS